MKRQEIIEALNLQLPVVASPMFIVSQQELVLSCCKQGILGTFPALNNRTTEGFEQWVIEIKDKLKLAEKEQNRPLAPFGVNLIVHKTNPRVQADLEVCVRQKVPLIITSLGAVKEVVDAVHSYGGLVFHDVTNKYHAQKAISAGVDGLILVCAGAGGHAGIANPFALVNEIREIFDGVILLAGGLSTGRDVAAALQTGADLAYMGTRFINTQEAVASDAYKNMIIESGTKDIVYTAAISGIPANFLGKSLQSAGITKELWEQKAKVDLGAELDTESKAWKDVWSAGQGVASIHDSPPVKDLVSRMKKEFHESIQEQAQLLDKYPLN